jgi:hypothetical protein
VHPDPAEHHDAAEIGKGDQDVEGAELVGDVVGE